MDQPSNSLLSIAGFAGNLELSIKERSSLREEIKLSSGMDVITWLELATRKSSSNMQKIQEKIILKRDLLNSKEFIDNQIVLEKINQFLSPDFINNIKFSGLESIQLAEIEATILMKRSEFETLKSKIFSQINDIKWLTDFLQINNIENISSPISNLDTLVVENYKGKRIIEATLEKIIINSRSILSNNCTDLALKKKISEGMELIRNTLLQPSRANITNLVNELKKLDDNNNYYWKIKVIPLESYLKKWDQLNQYQNQAILETLQNWKDLPVKEKEQNKKGLANKIWAKLHSVAVDDQQLEGEKKMETNNNTETKGIEEIELKKSDILNQEYKELAAVRKIDRLEKLVGDFISKFNGLKAEKENLIEERNNAKKNADDLAKKLGIESQKIEGLIKDAEDIVREGFSGLVELAEVLKLENDDKPQIEKLLVNHAIEEEGLNGLVTVIELKDEKIAEQDEKIETLETEKIDLKKEISKLGLTIDNNLVIAEENAAETLTNLISAEQTIRKLQLGVKLKPYVRFSERTEKLEIEGEFKKEEKTKIATEEESNHEDDESDHSEVSERIINNIDNQLNL